MHKILITGSTGLLGSSLTPYLKSLGYHVITHANKRLADVNFNLFDQNLTNQFLDSIKPDTIINLVSLTSVEVCEENISLAYLTNTRTVENIAQWIDRKNSECHLIQISTDHVYDGLGPHPEEDTRITNNYALTKYSAELAASLIKSSILRTNFVGRSKVLYRESLTDWVYRSVLSNKRMEVLEDVFFSPLSLTKLLELIAFTIIHKPIGIYNLGSNDGMSKADFDFMFAECLGINTDNMVRIEVSKLKLLRAYRPKDMRMDSTRFEGILGFKLPNLIDTIYEVADEYRT